MITLNSFDKPFEFKGKAKIWSIVLIIVGIAGTSYGFLSGSGERTFSNLLLNAYYFACVCICGICFSAISYVSKAGWSASIERIPQALAKILPVASVVLLLVIAAGLYFTHAEKNSQGKDTVLPYLYKVWAVKGVTMPGNPNYNKIIAGKSGFLNVPFFLVRVSLYLLAYCILGLLMKRFSEKEDIAGGMKFYKKNFSLSALFLFIFAFTIPLFAFDVIMSLEALWFSTLFGWYNFSGLWVSGITVITLIAIYLKKAGYFEWFTVDHLHTLGVHVFGWSIFWCYLWFEQFLLQYYSNIPEEAVYFFKRWEPQFNFWFWLNMTINFCAPFFVFMPRDSKRKWSVMKWTCIIIVAGHWLDYWQMILPGTVGPEAHWYDEIGIIELSIFAGFIGLFIYCLLTALSKFKSLVPKNHPFIQESLHHQVA